MGVDDDELARLDPTHVDVGRVRLDALVVAYAERAAEAEMSEALL
jgi:hypothetical protein